MISKCVFALSLLGTVTMAQGQTMSMPNSLPSTLLKTISVQDGSAPGNPVQLVTDKVYVSSDTLVDGNTQTFCHVLIKNPTGKNVSAYLLTIIMAASNGQTWQLTVPHDHFAADSTIAPLGAKIPVKFPCQRGEPTSLTLSFVQFEDGSSWGDSPAEQRMMNDRAAAVDFLNRVRVAYSQGDLATANALIDQKVHVDVNGKTIHSGLLDSLQYHLKVARDQDPTGAAAVKEVDARLTAIKAHAALVK